MTKLDPDFLISRQFSRHTKAALNLDEDSILTYYIDDSEGVYTLADGRKITTVPHSAEEVSFIEELFDDLDPLIAIDFKRVDNNAASDIDIYSVVKVSDWDRDVLGEVADQGQQRRAGAYWDVMWRDTNGKDKQKQSDLYSIVHEVGHALGLSHPKERPWSKKWNSWNTVMSYNRGPKGYNTSYSEADLLALQRIWGEGDSTQPQQPSVNEENEQPSENEENEQPTQPIEDGKPTGENDQPLEPVESDDLPNVKEWFGTKKADWIVASKFDDDVFAGRGDDLVLGRSGDDVLFGELGDDVLKGGKGDDIIDGGQGFNFAKGGKGKDLFVLDIDGYVDVHDFKINADECWVIKGSNTYWKWDWEWQGRRTILYDMRTGDVFADFKGRHDLDQANLFG